MARKKRQCQEVNERRVDHPMWLSRHRRTEKKKKKKEVEAFDPRRLPGKCITHTFHILQSPTSEGDVSSHPR